MTYSDPPEAHIRIIPEGSVTSPKEFKAAGLTCGIKQSGKPDLAIIASDTPAACAGVFTTNCVRAACVELNESQVRQGTAQAIVANSGNANCYTGDAGRRDAAEMCEITARELNLQAELVLGASTGVIGERLPMDTIRAGLAHSSAALSADGGLAAAEAIMTTDTRRKALACLVELSEGTIAIGAIAKGSGMIEPNMATMFCFLTTDARVDSADLQAYLKQAASGSFNCLSVDGDTSTNDMVLMLANGASGVAVAGSTDIERFQKALLWISQEMARSLAADGEGATKLIEISVRGAGSDDDAKRVAKTIANSLLVKTAMFGKDPNWGRIIAAAGRAGVSIHPNKLSLSIEGEVIVRNGEPVAMSQQVRTELLNPEVIRIDLDLGAGEGRAVVWTCDLSYEYVRINAEYHT